MDGYVFLEIPTFKELSLRGVVRHEGAMRSMHGSPDNRPAQLLSEVFFLHGLRYSERS